MRYFKVSILYHNVRIPKTWNVKDEQQYENRELQNALILLTSSKFHFANESCETAYLLQVQMKQLVHGSFAYRQIAFVIFLFSKYSKISEFRTIFKYSSLK